MSDIIVCVIQNERKDKFGNTFYLSNEAPNYTTKDPAKARLFESRDAANHFLEYFWRLTDNWQPVELLIEEKYDDRTN